MPNLDKDVSLSCKAWLGAALAAMTIGGGIAACTHQAWSWIMHQDGEVVVQHLEDATHDSALKVISDSLARQDMANKLGCAAGKYKKWYCDTWGLPYKTLEEDNEPTADTASSLPPKHPER